MSFKEKWTQFVDDLSFAKNILARIRVWGAETLWRKFVVYALFSAIVLTLPSYYSYTLLESSSALITENQKKRRYLIDKHNLESAIEIINMCIDARDKSLTHTAYYCNFAEKKYESFNDLVTIDEEAFEKAKNEQAYELMVFDLNGQLKDLEWGEFERNLPKNTFFERLKFIMSDIVVYTFLLVYIILMIGLLVLFNWKRQ